jgi:hypothetical protein
MRSRCCGAGLVALALAASCSVYDASLIAEGNAGVPDRPPPETSSPADAQALVFGLKDVFIRQSAEMAARTGINLDATVTSSRDDATCAPRSQDGRVIGQPVVDGQRGIDNSLGAHLLPTVGSALPCLEDNIAMTQGRGVGTIVLWVRDWNGQQDDASVTAVLTTAVDGTREDPSLVGFRARDPLNLVYLDGPQGTPAPDPGWASEDSWFLDPVDFQMDESGVPTLDRPKLVQVDGYIAAGRLVVPLLDDTEFKLIAGDGSVTSDGWMTVVVNGGFLIGDISEDHQRLERGLFAGRFSIEKLGTATPDIGMCDINASVIETLFGQFADIRSSPSDDGIGAECDAFSLGVTFNGVAGRVAGLAAFSRPKLQPCESPQPVEVDRCCPSEWIDGRSRLETCNTSATIDKAARFDALPPTIDIPVPMPEALY